MNPILLVAGVPFGILLCFLGDKLCAKVKPRSPTVGSLVRIGPLLVFVFIVILVDVCF